jgi:CBS domain-containing protein
MASQPSANWTDFISAIRCDHLIPEGFTLCFVSSTALLGDVIKTLANNKISSIPVMDEETNQFTGFIDMIDLLTLVVVMVDAKELAGVLSSKDIGWDEFIQKELLVFKHQTIGDMPNISERNPWAPVWEGFPLSSLLDMFSKNVNVHRVPVVDGNGQVVGLLTQSGVLEFLAQQMDHCPSANVKVDSFWKPSNKPTVSISSGDTAMNAFKKMNDFRVSGLPVVDGDGKIVGSISASDLRASTIETIFSQVLLPIKEFLANSCKYFQRDPNKAVTCRFDDTLRDVVKKVLDNGVHRIFIQEDDGTLAGVLSLCDIFSAIWQPQGSGHK